jgi:hypothetical protein
MTNPTPWDDASMEVLKRLRAEGYSCGSIAEELKSKGYNFSRNAVIGKMHRLNLPPPPNEVVEKRLKRQRQVTAGKIAARPAKVKFIWHRKPQSLGAQAVMEIPAMEVSNPTGSNAILLTDSRDGQCRAIVGYENGELSKAIICGDPTPLKLRRGKYIRISWCAHHNDLYTQEDRPHR